MEVGLVTIFHIIVLLITLDFILTFLIFFNKKRHKIEKEKIEKMDAYIIKEMIDKEEVPLKKDLKLFLERFAALKQIFNFDKETEKRFIDIVKENSFGIHFTKKLGSLIKYKRIEAMVYLGIIGTDDARKSLEIALKKEKNYSTKLYIINSLVDIRQAESIYKIVATIPNAPRWYREKVQFLLYEYGKDFYEYINEIKESDNSEIKELIIGFATIYVARDLKKYLINIIENPEEETFLVHKATRALSKLYITELNDEKYIYHSDFFVRGIAIETLANNQSQENLLKLISMLKDEEIRKHVVLGISNIIVSKPQYIGILINEFNKATTIEIKNALAEVLSSKIEYMILKLYGKKKDIIKNVIKEIMLMRKNSDIIGFLNRNKDMEIENEIIAIIKSVLEQEPDIKNEFCTYLNERVLKKCNLTKCVSNVKRKEEKRDKKVLIFLYCLIFIIFLAFPITYMIRHKDLLSIMPFMEQLKIYIIDFNYYLIYYSTAVNSIYSIILIFSFIGVTKQSKEWNLKKITFLFKEGILPSISIIAPAFNEEATIIESANSLLNLKYPDYELIIVNDGSKDNTIQTLIQYFNLEKVDMIIEEKLKAMPIRGIYRNKYMPKLTVVDKENGGKADSLNTGINISSKEYFCGIDADSLLETDALLKLTSLTIDQQVECPAMGGNIFPINGCSVDTGMITNLKIPQNNIARLQTIEYIRAFMAGRVGWAQIDCLLIISGAFGLFKKDRIIEIGGYLTSSGKYKKDTVGEDMELVVRLSRHMIEKKKKFKINYAFNANCWTEVPESYKVLKRQRDRWHRGLIDILTFHKKMIFNPRYGKIGTIAFPYFFIFEMMGPLVEVQGYLMVVLAAILGLLNMKIALFLFISTILMGVLISLSSLYMAEKETDYFTIKELMILILYSIVENFGPRQLISLWRVGGYISSLKKPKGWGKMERKGFAKVSHVSEGNKEANFKAYKVKKKIGIACVTLSITMIILLGIFYLKDNKSSTMVFESDGISRSARVDSEFFYVFENGKWKKEFIKGVNIGAAKPGNFPGELAITKEEYLSWFSKIGEMNANSIRVYTTLEPEFYDALYEYNQKAKNKLYIFQGLWINEDKSAEYNDSYKMMNEIQSDAKNLIDVLHGNCTLPERPGFASGTYTKDVSQYVIGWILGTEWSPDVVEGTNANNVNKSKYDGEFLFTENSSPFEAFLCEMGDYVIKYETQEYKTQRPLAFTNWVTTDMLSHPNEPDIREDKVSVNTEHIKAKDTYKNGLFASYHIYPYYPEFMSYQKDYASFKDKNGNADPYEAYLQDLRKEHTVPVLVSEFGIPAARGIAHENVISGFNQGNIDEKTQGEMDSKMLQDIYDEDYAGGIVFSWQDEWFKRTWNTMDFDLSDRRPFWSNTQTNEQEFGLMAFDPGKEKSTCYVDGDISDWKEDKPLVEDENGKLYMKSDEKYVYFLASLNNYNPVNNKIMIPIDSIENQGNSNFTQYNIPLKRDSDFAIVIDGKENASILVDSYYDSFYYTYSKSNMIDKNAEYEKKNSGIFNPMYLCLNRKMLLPEEQKEIPFSKFETGKLIYGDANPEHKDFNSLADYCINGNNIEIRIPWQLLNVMDPSSKMIMNDLYTNGIKPIKTEGIYAGLIQIEGKNILQNTEMKLYSWNEWDIPEYHERLKPSYYILKDAFGKIGVK